MTPATPQALDVQFFFVDLQDALLKQSRTVSPDVLTNNAGVLAKIANILGAPITISIVPVHGDRGVAISTLDAYTSEDNIFHRVAACTFMESGIVARLAQHARGTLVVAGYATEVAVLQTALGALAAGYRVFVVVDIIGSRSTRTESAALREMERAGVMLTSALALSAQLAPDFALSPGTDVLKTFEELLPPN